MESGDGREASKRGTYESFLREVVKDFDEKVLAIQEVAEYNSRKYVQYCAELKTTLQNVASTLQLLKSAMTAHLVYKNDMEEKYQCMVEDGTLAGHKFTLTWDATRGDYTYDPSRSPCQQHLTQLKCFMAHKLYFPHDMLNRFIANVQYFTYHTS